MRGYRKAFKRDFPTGINSNFSLHYLRIANICPRYQLPDLFTDKIFDMVTSKGYQKGKPQKVGKDARGNKYHSRYKKNESIDEIIGRKAVFS